MAFETLTGFDAGQIAACGNFTYDTSFIHVQLNNINQTLTNLQCFDMCRSKAVLDFQQPFLQMMVIIVIMLLIMLISSLISPRYSRLCTIIFSTVMLLYMLVMLI